jgi:hypothetical protein
MALPPREPGSRRTRQGGERLAVSIRVQRGTIIVGQALRLPSRAFPIHPPEADAWQAMRLPYNLFLRGELLRACTSVFPNPSQWAFDSVNRIVLRQWQSRNIVIGFRSLAR